MCAQQCRSAGAPGGDLHRILNLDTGSGKSRLFRGANTAFALGIFWDAAFGRDADTAAEVESKACSGACYDLVFTQN